MSPAPFDPSSFFVPDTDPDRLEYTAGDLTGDGADITESAGDIHTAWGGLASCYSAPESGVLFAAVDSVPDDAEEVNGALGTAATALGTFAEKARKLRKEAWALQGDARRFNDKVADDEDWAQGTLWGQESEEYTEYSRINSERIRIQNDFMAAEAECANAILALFSARRYTAVNPDGSTTLRGGQVAYGFTEVTEELENAWGGPKVDVDHYWFWDVQHAVWDFGSGIVENAGGMVGMHGAGGWDFAWGTNAGDHWWGVVEGAGAMVGLYDAEIDHWGFQSWERSREIAWETGVEAAHAVVPWREWGERPGYVIATAALNAGTIAAGVALSATGVGAVVGVPLLAYKGLKIFDGIGGGTRGPIDALQNLIDNAASGRHAVSGGGSGQATPVVSLSDDTLRTLGIDPQRLHTLLTGLEGLRDQDTRSPSGDGTAPVRPADPTAAGLAAGREFLDGVDPRSRAEVEEGLRDQQDLWVVSQVPDDVSAVHDTPVQRYETDPSLIEAQNGQRVEVDSAGNEITARHETPTVTNSTGDGSNPRDTPRGTTAVTDPAPGRGGTVGGGGDGPTGPRGGSTLPEGPDRDPLDRIDFFEDDLLPEDTSGQPDRLDPGSLEEKLLKRDDPAVEHLLPGKGEKFGSGINLEPNSRYVLYETDENLTTEYLTDAEGNIREIHADSKGWNAKHPEFMDPRPNMTYVVDSYTFRTDGSSRTVSVEGTLQQGENVRNEAQQDVVNTEAKRYFQLLNEQYGEKYQDIQWDAGHLVGSQEFLGIGERLNLAGMRFDVNQNRVDTALPDIPKDIRGGIQASYRNVERAWRGILNHGDKWHLFDDPRFKEDTWRGALMLNPANPEINVRISAIYDPDLPKVTDPATKKEILPPPSSIVVDWSLNGVDMRQLRYNNIPPFEK